MGGHDIKRIRGGLQLSQSEFAVLLGVSVRTVQDWEQDKNAPGAPAVALLKAAEQGLLTKRPASKRVNPQASIWDKGALTDAELEQGFSEFVLSYGGERVADLLQEKHKLPLNADYLLWERSVVAELKTITADHFSDPRIGQKLLALSQQWVRDGLIPPLPPGRSIVSTEGLPLKQLRRAYKILTKPIAAAVDQASRQIRSTKECLKLPNAKGLIIVANVGDRSLAPKVAIQHLEYVLAQHTRTIHSFIFFSPTFDPKMRELPLGLWMSGSTAHPEGGVGDELINSFGDAWHKYTTQESGAPRIDFPQSYLK